MSSDTSSHDVCLLRCVAGRCIDTQLHVKQPIHHLYSRRRRASVTVFAAEMR